MINRIQGQDKSTQSKGKYASATAVLILQPIVTRCRHPTAMLRAFSHLHSVL